MLTLLQSLLGIFILLLVGWLLSENRRVIAWRVIGVGLSIQIVAALAIFHLPFGRQVFLVVNQAVVTLLAQAQRGAEFVFGPLAVPPGEPGSLGFVLAFQALPTAIFFAALTALLYHVGLLPKLIRGFTHLFRRSLGVSGVEAMTAASNLFVGIESALTIRPYLAKLQRHELAVILTAGMATIASTVLGIYVAALAPVFPTIAGHLLTANFLSAPAAIIFARLLIPPSAIGANTAPEPIFEFERKSNWIESLTSGSQEGLKLVFGITAVLIAFVGLLALLNVIVGGIGGWFGHPGFQIQTFLGWIFAPFAWLIGVPTGESVRVGELLGLRLVATEVPAYFELSKWMTSGLPLDPRTMVITVYALCGFAHVPSLGIFVGGLTALVPERAADIGSIAIRCLIAATLACLLTGAIAGLVCGPNPSSLLACR